MRVNPNYCLQKDYVGETFSQGTLNPHDLCGISFEFLSRVKADIEENRDSFDYNLVQECTTYGLKLHEIAELLESTRKLADTINSFLEFKTCAQGNLELKTPVNEITEILEEQEAEQWYEIYDWISYLAPHGAEFGSLEGDASHLGWWEIREEEA